MSHSDAIGRERKPSLSDVKTNKPLPLPIAKIKGTTPRNSASDSSWSSNSEESGGSNSSNTATEKFRHKLDSFSSTKNILPIGSSSFGNETELDDLLASLSSESKSVKRKSSRLVIRKRDIFDKLKTLEGTDIELTKKINDLTESQQKLCQLMEKNMSLKQPAQTRVLKEIEISEEETSGECCGCLARKKR